QRPEGDRMKREAEVAHSLRELPALGSRQPDGVTQLMQGLGDAHGAVVGPAPFEHRVEMQNAQRRYGGLAHTAVQTFKPSSRWTRKASREQVCAKARAGSSKPASSAGLSCAASAITLRRAATSPAGKSRPSRWSRTRRPTSPSSEAITILPAAA